MNAGLDEVGRGALAGPLCIAAVVLGEAAIDGLTDSKKLSKKRREFLADEIIKKAEKIGIGWVSAKDIDRIGMSEALKVAATRAFSQIDSADINSIIIDGTIKLLDDPRVTTMKQADLLVPSVSAASIVAKVARDRYMEYLSVQFPEYQFTAHVGYGTAAHLKAISENGPSSVHRHSFAPMNTTSHLTKKAAPVSDGQHAEATVREYLTGKGFKILANNWKTKWCEIDIVASKQGSLYFVEVKYRRSSRYGDGLAAITPKKKRQMKFAAEMWLHTHPHERPFLAVASVSGDSYDVESFIEVLE